MRWHRKPKGPVPPEGVRLVLRDGRKVVCDVLYDGLGEEGAHRWYPVPAVRTGFEQVAAIEVDLLPARTEVVFAP